MVLIGAAFLVVWLLFVVFTVTLEHALLATAIIFLVLGLISGERPWSKL